MQAYFFRKRGARLSAQSDALVGILRHCDDALVKLGLPRRNIKPQTPEDRKMQAHPLGAAGALVFTLALAASGSARAEELGSVSTAFKLIGPNHKVVVEAYDDPKVGGVTCYVSRARTGGIAGGLGLAEDRAEASIACRQVGPISFTAPLPVQEEVFSERMSVLFKRLRVVRLADAKRNALVYLSYSDKLIDGSPQNSVSAVPVEHGQKIPVR